MSKESESATQNPTVSPYEKQFGFCRAVRVGNHIAIAGTAPIGPDGKTVSPNDAGRQARRCFDIIKDVLEQLDSELTDVVRTRMYLTHIDDWEEVGRVHGEYFGDVQPVSTMVEVARLIDSQWRVEFEADAIVGETD